MGYWHNITEQAKWMDYRHTHIFDQRGITRLNLLYHLKQPQVNSMCVHGVCKTLDTRWSWLSDTSRRMNKAATQPAALRASGFWSGVRAQRNPWDARTHVACRTEQKRTAAELSWVLRSMHDTKDSFATDRVWEVAPRDLWAGTVTAPVGNPPYSNYNRETDLWQCLLGPTQQI